MPRRRMLLLAAGAHVVAGANPIRKIVNMLQTMVAKTEAEGKAQEQLYNKFICYCKNGKGSLEKAIADAEDKTPKVSNAIERTEAELKQLQADLAAAKAERGEAQAAVKEAKALRAKEAGAFAKTSGDFTANIAAMGKAISALESGAAGGSFLQSSVVSLLKKISLSLEMKPVDRETFSAFLTTGTDHTYAPQSGEITGILKQMKETMEGDLAEAEAKEAKAIEEFEGMVAAKNKLIREIGATVEKKTQRIGDAGVELVELKADLSDTQEQLLDDKKFLEELGKNCATKADEWAETSKVRSDEILALHETIKILNDDDALELFKKTLPSASLIQVKSVQKLYRRAADTLKNHHDVRSDFVALALQGKKVSMGKVVEMIDNMVKLLGQEQSDDEAKKTFCEKQLKETQDEIKGLEWHIEDVGKAIEQAKESVATLVAEIKELTSGIAALDEQVATATEQRKNENKQFTSDAAENRATVELLGIAKNRMNKFYNPSLYKAPPKRELSKADRVAVELGLGTAPPTEAPGGIANTGVTVLTQSDPGPAPDTGKYTKKTEESTGVIALIDRLIADVNTEMVENETEEKNAQKAYEQLSKDAAAKRASDVQSVKDKTAAKVEAEAKLLEYNEDAASTKKDLLGKVKSLGGVHQECDWLMQNFDVRASARADEVESLKRAKAVLAGADYAFLETNRVKSFH